MVLPDPTVVVVDAVGSTQFLVDRAVAGSSTLRSSEINGCHPAGLRPDHPPLIAVSYAQASGAIYGTITTTIIIGAIAWSIGLVPTWRGMSGIRRQRMLGVADGV